MYIFSLIEPEVRLHSRAALHQHTLIRPLQLRLGHEPPQVGQSRPPRLRRRLCRLHPLLERRYKGVNESVVLRHEISEIEIREG